MQIDAANRTAVMALAREISLRGESAERLERLAEVLGMEPDAIEDARRAGLCAGKAEGRLASSVVVLMLPKVDATRLLPLGLELAPHPLGGVGTHPVFLQFSRYDFDALGGMHYDEVMLGVPFVQLATWKAPRRGPFIYMPRLYLDASLPQQLGVYLYGYEKQLATIEQQQPDERVRGHSRVRDRRTGAPILDAVFTPDGPRAAPDSFRSFAELRQLFEMPTISQAARIWDDDAFSSDDLSPMLASTLTYAFDDPRTWVQPITARVDVHPTFTPSGVPTRELRRPSLLHAPLGAFRISTRVGVALPGSPAAVRYPRPAPPRPQRVLVLGGGPAACSAAYWLASQKERYTVDLYTLGWRLGGKCAAGRNPQASMRIEEHGLHAFLGFYQNAFRTVRDVWDTAGISIARGDEPLGGAFLGSAANGLMIEREGTWRYYETPLPTNDRIPGVVPPQARDDHDPDGADVDPESSEAHGLGQAMIRAFEQLVRLVVRVDDRHADASAELCATCHRELRGSPLDGLRERLRERSEDLVEGRLEELLRGFVRYLENVAALTFARWLAEGPDGPLGHVATLARLARRIVDGLVDRFGDDDEVWYLWMTMNTTLTVIIGLIEDRVVHLDRIDHLDTWTWLKNHGLDPRLLPEDMRPRPVTGGQPNGSPAIAAVYETLFAHGTNAAAPRDMAAGVGVRWYLLTAFGYSGHPAWLFEYSCPQTMMTPYYEALTGPLGARVHFFHRVTELTVEGQGDARRLTKVKLRRQATVRGGSHAYDPFVPDPPRADAGAPAPWPIAPNYDQLKEGETLREQGIDLESPWSPWPGVEDVELVQGRDFDLCVLGISLGALPPITKALWEPASPTRDPRWTAMVEDMAVTRTISMQLWFDATEDQLYEGERGLLTEYVLPEPSMGNFTHVLKWEGWSDPPGYLAYHTGSLTADRVRDLPPFDDHEYPARTNAQWFARARQWLKDNHAAFYDRAPGDWEGFCALLRAPDDATTADERLAAQYFNAGINPSDRYVLSQPRGMPARMGQMESGVRHLYLCGDWTKTDMNCGCVEAATQSGMLCAQGLSQVPTYIWRVEF